MTDKSFDEIVSRFTGKPKEDKLQNARQRAVDKAKEQLTQRLVGTEFEQYLPKETSNPPIDRWWETAHIGHGKPLSYKIPEKTPTRNILDAGQDLVSDGLKSLNQGVHQVLKTGATVGDIAGHWLVTNPKKLYQQGTQANLTYLPKKEEAYTTRLLNTLGYDPDAYTQALETMKSPHYQQTKERIDQRIAQETGLQKYFTAFSQTLRNPSVGLPMVFEATPEMLISGDAKVGVGTAEATIATLHHISDMVANDLDIDKNSAMALLLNASLTKAVGDGFKTHSAVDDIVSNYVNPTKTLVPKEAATLAQKAKGKLKDTGKEITEESITGASDEATSQYIHTGTIDVDEVLASAGREAGVSGVQSGAISIPQATGKVIGGTLDLTAKGIKGVSNLKAKLTTPSIDKQLDSTEGNKHFNPSSAYLRATEIINNSQDSDEIKQAKKHQDEAVKVVNDRLGKFDEAIENQTDETKKQQLIQKREKFFNTHYQPVVNATKAVNGSDTEQSNSALDFAQRQMALSDLQNELSWLDTLTDPVQKQQATQAIQQKLFSLGGGQTSQSAIKILTPKEGKSVTLQLADGTVVKRTGNRNWRNNNAGNIEYGQFAKDNGAIGSDGRFAIFPDKQTGDKAKEKLLFESKSYKKLTLSQAISRYAPPVENNTQSYQNAVLSVVGGQNKKMSEYTPKERQAIMDKMAQVEGFKEGQITVISQGSAYTPKAKPHNLPDSLSSKQAKEYVQSQGIPVFNSRGDKNEPFAGGETKGDTLGFAGLVYNAIGSAGINGFTAFNDGYHKGRKSNHAKGLAFDISVKDKSVEGMARLRQQIQTLAKQNGYNVRVVAEHPTGAKQGKEGFKWYSHSTGSHIHVDVFGLVEPSEVSIEPQGVGEAIEATQDELGQLLERWDNEDKTQELQQKIISLENELAGLQEHTNPTQENLQSKLQQQMDKLKTEQGKDIAIRYAQINPEDTVAVDKAKQELDDLQSSGLLDDAQADNLRKLLDIKVAIKGTNQEDVHHQIVNGRRGSNNLETNLGLKDYDQVLTMALASNNPDTATIERYMGMLTRFRDSHTDKATAFKTAYDDAQEGNSIYLIPKRTDNRVVWERGNQSDFNEAKSQNSSPIEIHKGSGKFVNQVVFEASLISDFTNTWDNVLSQGNPISQPVQQTDTVNVGRGLEQGSVVSLSNYRQGQIQVGDNGWLGNPYNVSGNPKNTWQVTTEQDRWANYANLLIKTLKEDTKARQAFMALQDKELSSTTKGDTNETHIITGLLNELKGKNDSQVQQTLNNLSYDNTGFVVKDKDSSKDTGIVVGDIATAKANKGFYVGRGKNDEGQFVSLSTAKRFDKYIGQQGWLGNPYNTDTQSKKYKVKDKEEGLANYTKDLKNLLLNNDKALAAFLALQGKQLYKGVNGDTEAEVVSQILETVQDKTKEEARQIISSITGFRDGQVQNQEATNSGNKNGLHKRKQDYADKTSVQQDNPTNQIQKGQNKSSHQTSQGEPQTTSSVAQVKASDANQNTINQTDNQSKLTPKEEAKKILQGKPVATVSKADVPTTGLKDVEKWAKEIFKGWDNKAVNAVLGEIALTSNSVRDTMHHSKSQFKFATFPALKDVLEKGAVIHHTSHIEGKLEVQDYFISAPVSIDGSDDIVTVLIKQDTTTKRMYVHSVTAKERLMTQTSAVPVDKNPVGKQKASSDLVHNILHDLVSDKSDTDNNDPFAHLTDEDVERANAQVESVRESEAERQALDLERALAEANNENLDLDYYNDYDTQDNKETAKPSKKTLKDKVKVKVKVKAELTGVKPLSQVIDDLGLDNDSLMVSKAISELYELRVSFDGTTGKDIVSADNLIKELIAYSTNDVLSQLKKDTDDKKLSELKDSIKVIKDKLKTTDTNPKLISEALDSDYNLVAMAVTNAEFKNLLMGIEHTEKVHKNLFSKLVYGLMSVFGIPSKTSVNNLYEKALTTLGDLIQYQATNNQSLRAGNLSVLQNVDRQAELKKPILAKMAGEEQNLIKAGITQGIKKPLASVKNLSIKLASEGLSVLAHDKPTDKQLAQLEHFLAFKNEMADLLQQALPKDNYSNWDYQDLKQALIREGIDDNLLTAMALSAYDKILADGGKTYHSRDDVAKLLGFKPEQVDIPQNVHHEFLHIHAHLPSFATDLGKQITGTLELSQTKDVPAQTLARLEASLGNWLISALQIGGYVHTITMPKNEYEGYKAEVEDKVPVSGDDKATLTFISFTDVDGNNKSELIEEIQEVSKETGGYLAKLFGAESFKRYPKMDKPTKVKDKIRKTKSKVSENQAKKIDKAQQEAIYINQDMEKVLKALDSEIQEMLGAVVTDEELAKMHVSKRKGAKERAEAIQRELDNHKEWSAFVGDKPFYDTVTVAVNKRMHYDSNVWNFQSSTVQRAFGEPQSFKVTIPLDTGFVDSKGKPTAMGLFMRAIFENAEGTEKYFEKRLRDKYPKGWTVDKLPTTDFIAVALDYIQEPHVQKAIIAIQKTQQGQKLSADDITAIKNIVKEWEMEARSLRALMELSNFTYAMANGKEFTTSLGLGSDGVNNGIGIAHVLMGINDELTLAQVGILKEQYSSYFATRTDKNIGDYYESFGVALNAGITRAVNGIKNHKEWDDKFKQILLNKAHAIEQLSTTLKKRATYKAIIIPFGYGAGFKRLQQAASEQMISDIIRTLEDIHHGRAKKGTYEETNKHLKTLLGKGFNLPPVKELLEFEFSKEQINELKKSHQAFLGRAIGIALQKYAGKFIERRTNFIQMQEMASVGFVKAKEILTNNVLKEHQDKVAKSSEFAKRAVNYIGLDGHQLDELESRLAPVRPKVESIYSLNSNSDDTAKIQLTTNERTLVTDETKGNTKELVEGELVNKQRSLLTQAITEASNGVTPNSQTVQSTDSYVSSEAMVAEGVVSINVHDANIASLIHYFTMAMTQNKAFFYGTAMYHLGYQNIKTLVDTLTGIQALGLTDKELSDIHKKMVDSLGENFDFGDNTLIKDKLKFYVGEMLQMQIDNDLSKLDMYLGMTTIHQYAGEGGEYKLTQKDYDFLNQEKEHLLGLKDKLQEQIDGLFGETIKETQVADMVAADFTESELTSNRPHLGQASATGVKSSLPQVSTPDRQSDDSKNQTNVQSIKEQMHAHYNHTDSSYGSDAWHRIGKTFGVSRQIRYTPPKQAVNKKLSSRGFIGKSLSLSEIAKARNNVNKLLGTTYEDDLEDNFKVTIYHGINQADSVFVLGSLTADKTSVDDDTDMAVRLAIALNKPLYVWDTVSEKWHYFEEGSFVTYEGTPTLTKNFTGIASDSLSSYTVIDEISKEKETNPNYLGNDKTKKAKQAIKDVYQATQDKLQGQIDGETKQANQSVRYGKGETNDEFKSYISKYPSIQEATKAYFKEKLQGKVFKTKIGDVHILGSSWHKKLKAGIHNDDLKAKAIFEIPNILKDGKYEGSEPTNKTRKDDFIAFHSFTKEVVIDDNDVFVRLLVGERENNEYEFVVYSIYPNQENKNSGRSNPRSTWASPEQTNNTKNPTNTQADKSTDKNQPQNTTKANNSNGVSIDKTFDKKVLDTYAKDAKEGQKELYEMLLPLIPNHIKFATGTLPNPNAVAGFVGDTIVFNADALRPLSATDKMRYVNHEIIHALTEYGLSKDNKASQDLQKMYEQLKPLANTDKLKLAFDNINEFVAYGLTDKSVQEFILDNLDTKALGIKTPSKIKNALDNFLKAVFSLFGLNKSASYKTFVSAVDTVIQEGLGKPTDIQQPRYASEEILTDRQQAIDILQGEPVATINQDDVDMPKQGGFKAITEWAIGIFAKQGGKAVNPVLGDVLLNEQSVRDSLGHGRLNFFKNLAFPLVKDVIEQGAIIAKDTNDVKEDSYFISAPVLINDKPNIITVTVHKDSNTQRMYLHSVTMTEKVLAGKKDAHLADRVSEALDDNHRTQNSSQINQVGNTHLTNPVSEAPVTTGEQNSWNNISQVSNSAVGQNTKTYGKSGRISKNHNGSITPNEIHNILHDLLTSKPSIRYAQTTATDSFKQLDKGKVSDDFNNHLDGLIDRFIGSYDKADVDKIDKLATDGLPHNAKLLQLGLSSKEAHVIQALTLVYTAYLKDNGTLASNRLKDLYKDAQKQFKTAKDLYPDYDTMDNQSKLMARNIHQFVFNNKTQDDNVARFMALTLGSEQFKALIDSHQIKKTRDTDTWFDKTMLAMQTVLDWFIGKSFKSTGSHSEQIKGLLKHLAKLEADSRLSVSDKIQEDYEQGFRFVFNPLNKAVKSVLAKTFDNELFINSRFGWLQTAGKAAKFMNSDKRDEVAQDFVAQMQGGMFAGSRMNTVMEALNELTLQGIRGKVIDATTRITQKLGQTRQQVEANTYKALKDSFESTTKEENIAVTHALIKTDIQALLSAGFSVNEAMALLDETKRQKTIARYQDKLKDQIKDSRQFNTTMHAINSLGLYMATGITSLHLQKNSDNIARGIGTWYSTDKLDTDKAKTIDVLATLYALNHTEDNKLKTAKELYLREPEGVSRTLYLHQDMVKKGKEDFATNPLNYQKGYTTQLFNPYSKVVFVTSLEEQMELEKKGFETIGELEQDPLDKKEKSILMIDKFHSPNNYVSGMLDMYDTSHRGTEIYNSRTEPKAIGKIVNEKIAQMERVAHLSVEQVNPMDTQGAMIANYNTDQSIDNYRYEMNDKSRQNLLEQDMDFIHILSAQNANLVYKPEIKKQQIKSANLVIEDAKNFKKYPSQYVLLDFNSKDPAVQQMMALIPYPFRKELEAHFGRGNPIPIHSTMYNALFGFRAYSLVEAFDKLDNPFAKLNFAERALTGTMTLLFKDKARHHTLLIEKVVQTLMSYIKEAIVVKSGAVLMGNIIQNLWLLAMHGINPLQIAHGVIGAWRNSKRFATDSNRLTELEVLVKSTKDKHKISAYKKEMKTVQERLDTNPMKQFMEAGMMSTIVEDLAMQEETNFKSHYEQKIATVTDKIPDFIKTPVNLLMVNKGSLPYQFLAEATQFSDLAAKYVLTEHHYKNQVKKGVNKNKAMTDAIYLAQESFVNYDIPTSRTLDYLNRVGLMVFTKFWLRFQKALFRFAIHAPAQSLITNEVAEYMTGTGIYDPFLLARLGNNPFDGSLLLADDAVGNLITTSVLF